MSNAKRPKKPSFKDQAIDVDDLASMSNMGGMLSFLDTKPEDYARLFAKAAEVDTQAGVTTTQTVTTHTPTTPVESTQGPTTQVETQKKNDLNATTQAATTRVITTHLETTRVPTTHGQESQTARPVLVKSAAPFRRAADILSQIELLDAPEEPSEKPTTQVTTTQAQALGLSPSVSLGQGRVHKLKIREAKIVQDGHTGTEQMVYDFLWRTAQPLNANLRSIRIGRWGIANAIHISDTSAKAALKGLIEKLAIEKVGSFDKVLGFEYHVHSWGSCLSRRKEHGLTHVIKSKGVVFVNPDTGTPLTGYFFPSPRTRTTQATTTQVAFEKTSNPTRVVAAQDGGVESDTTTQVVLNPYPNNQLQNQNTITATLVRFELQQHTTTDEVGVKALIRAVQDNAPDATWPELRHFIREKAKVFQKAKIDNRFGFLLVAVPRCFESPSFNRWRQAGGLDTETVQERLEQAANAHFMQVQHLRFILDNPESSEQELETARALLEALEG